MYNIHWDESTNGILLADASASEGISEIRPVFYEELDLLGFDRYWSYPKVTAPLLWASAGRRYFYKGRPIAEARGGGFYELPELVVHEHDIAIEPIDTQEVISRNSALLDGLEHRAVEFIYDTVKSYRGSVDIISVAFSGGKDSIVLLDLVQRALSPSEFVVIFSDTTMEIASTYRAIELAKQRFGQLSFHTARADKTATETWLEMGPPSRIHRWCCPVHKSAPSLFKLRELTGNPSTRALVFDGIRWDESQARSGYKQVTEGGKHGLQVNASPLVRWNATEIFLYLLSRDLFLNDAYRHGLVRVGCAVCPMSSSWWDAIAWTAYNEDIQPFLSILEKYAGDKQLPPAAGREFIREGGWKGRAGGRVLESGGSRVIEGPIKKCWEIAIRNPKENWLTWINTLGRVSMLGLDQGSIPVGSRSYGFKVQRHDDGLLLQLEGFDQADKFLVSHLRAVNNKTAYCTHCRGCEAECPTGALTMSDRVVIDEELCAHCKKCLVFAEKGCLAAKSLGVSMGEPTVKGLNRYQHFGMRKSWLEEYFTAQNSWWVANSLGNRQFDAMRVWLKEAEITEQKCTSPLGLSLTRLTADAPLTWLIIWTNLFKNSALVNWFVTNVPWGETFDKQELADRMSPALSQSTRGNAVTSLVGLLKDTPLGNELGIVVLDYQKSKLHNIRKVGTSRVEQLGVLYSLFRYAEQIGRHKITLSELFETADGGPHLLFGMDKDSLEKCIRGLAGQFPSWIEADLVRDLDNIFLNEEHHSSQVPGLGG